ncbi:16S rRNA (guanine(966)-N(2))-methyltransferase RsmD [Alteromonas sp. ASW11-36]|uniref:Ribosomal RNA small subunit methyltransferase D n=1 Tax=Alteromonas arenosi TaxID=3055817 RepID=A0ABT7SYM5_9ALTE|nr:16S rRNA (guanine(966)-N(2))-methyltransferase RsmD [Alteromonas sp. ASW11-36]MDM7861296.1 16S rRNA (guanine(966)-N(2))-methyltransferase RsmD [Alteromonas sp. ASW11-36]
MASILALTRNNKRDSKRNKAQTNRSSSGSIRIIGGQWRGRKLPVRYAQGLRPTTDRTKETLFNWLMHDTTDAVCLDLFAGSGSLGFEALSRYARTVTLVEKDAANARQLQTNLATLNLSAQQATVIQQDALQVLPTLGEQYDLIFIDPPFHQGLAEQALALIQQHKVLKHDGLLYIETESELADIGTQFQLQQLKQKSTGQVAYGLWCLSAD